MTVIQPSWRGMFLLVTLLSLSPVNAQDIWQELPAARQSDVSGGKQIVITESIEGKIWPRVKIYRTVNASPEEVAAVFVDYENGKSFIPNLIKSKISKQVSSCNVEVDYGIDVPILPDEYYTVRNILEKSDLGYVIKWKLLRAVQTKDSEGSLRIQPWQGKAVICYQNLVTPGSGMAVLLRGKAISQMQDTVRAIAAQVEKEKASDPALLEQQVKALRSALSSD